ncbi:MULTISPECIES: restriction endonuclease [unclassified Bradyrhizobium]|uniref:nSTAND3 domain-containing NTPase n=1 Tax=unclassified Bradyrhizobium TaxID=2631580 RepID=UPI00291706CA|nr:MULTISPECIES: restriction endonuclease [unclassified Bradyrhizobium]
MLYDFQQLSPHDLEMLVQDLLQAEWGVILESFKTGRDGGIDLRYARVDHGLIVQVKHYVRTGLSGLLRDLKAEAAKVSALNPSRYVVVTSVPLSPGNKQAIVEIFRDRVLAVADILGQEDLNNLLRRHPSVEQKHFKLWLASRAVLDRVLHNDVMVQTEFQIEKVYASIRRYVQSSAYPTALQILGRDRVVIISGGPGVGKTTLANMLLYAHLERGWEPVVIRRDIAEGQRLFQRGRSQIFYFDDFMGATFLGDRGVAIRRSEDRAISDFIKLVGAAPNARLVLTTREHIFGQALSVSERLRQAGLDSHKIVLRIGDYSFGQRAQILYNHVYFSDLPDVYRDELLASDFYLEIVKHPKFNPRLIEWLSSYSRLRSVPPNQYRTFIRNLLKDPSEVWMHAYERELNDAGRSLLLALYGLGGKAEGTLLQAAFANLHAVRARRHGFNRRPEDWSTAMAELINAFIRPQGKTAFEVLDPSVTDLVNAVVRKAPENAADMVIGAIDFSQIDRVWELSKAGGASIATALIQGGADVAAAIKDRVSAKSRLMTFENSTFAMETSPEARLAAVLPIADRLRTAEMSDLAVVLSKAMETSWLTSGVNINDGVEALRALEAVTWTPLTELVGLAERLSLALVCEAQRGCRSDELREVVSVLDLDGPDNADKLDRLRGAFENSRQAIGAEIGSCRKEQDFKGLEEDFELFASCLGVDVSEEMERLQEAYSEYDGYEEQRADAMMDDYRDQYRESRASEASVRDMFGSLRGDRSS